MVVHRPNFKMITILKIDTTEIILCLEHTFYNHLVYKFLKPNRYNATHIIEVYDDVSEEPQYSFVKLVDLNFDFIMNGFGEPVPRGKYPIVGASFNVELY